MKIIYVIFEMYTDTGAGFVTTRKFREISKSEHKNKILDKLKELKTKSPQKRYFLLEEYKLI